VDMPIFVTIPGGERDAAREPGSAAGAVEAGPPARGGGLPAPSMRTIDLLLAQRAVDGQGVDDGVQRSGDLEYVLFPDEGHGFRKLANRVTSTVAITRFFVKYLK
jgi:hypothetical protein